MTWGEFKKLVDSEVTDDTPVTVIDVYMPGPTIVVEILADGSLSILPW